MITDNQGRTVNYIRMSVTDRCNLRCFYCCSPGSVKFIPHNEILRYEEMFILAKAAQKLGVEKLRLTGGEPFVRRGFMGFLELLQTHCPRLDVRITTNGTLLKGKAAKLKGLGVNQINVSLDTLIPARFEKITGKDLFHNVYSGIMHCLDQGLQVKLNVVAVKELNSDELPAFLDLAMQYGLDVRFIEFMPIGTSTSWQDKNIWKADEILASAAALAPLTPVTHDHKTDGPARMFTITGTKGRLGVISPMTHHFCLSCNRLRITSNGRLRTCLFSDKEYRLRPILRNPGLSSGTIIKILKHATQNKPLGYKILQEKRKAQVCNKIMHAIGG